MFRLVLARACLFAECFDEALEILRPVPFETMSNDDILMLFDALEGAGRVGEAVSIALSYQRQNGYVMPLLQRVVSPLRKGDPMMMASVFAEAPKEMRLDWQMFYENMRLN